MSLPNLFIIGAPRCGTTALHNRLERHPLIGMSALKEPNHYLFDGAPLPFSGPYDGVLHRRAVLSRRGYLDLFSESSHLPVRGESSPFYLYSEKATEGIRRDIPDAKIIVLVRDPVVRAHSHYLMLRRDGREPAASFAQALALEQSRIARGWAWSYAYAELGFYARHVDRWIETFGQENVLVLTNEEFRLDEGGSVEAVTSFLGLPEVSWLSDVEPDVNVAGVPRLEWLHAYLTQPRKSKTVLQRFLGEIRSRQLGRTMRRANLLRPELPADIRRSLEDLYGAELQEIQRLIGWRISLWPSAAPEPRE